MCLLHTNQDTNGEELYLARSHDCGKNLLTWALESNNWAVHARLNTSMNPADTAAADIYYHRSCYTTIKNEARSAKAAKAKASSLHNQSSKDQSSYDPLVFSQLIAYVRYGPSPIKLSELQQMYEYKLVATGSDWRQKTINCTRFKLDILKKLGPDWSNLK